MADVEIIKDLPVRKAEQYQELVREAQAILDGENHPISRMSTLIGILHNAFDYFSWTGFYLVDPENSKQLVIGPYQGTLGCLRIAFGKGVCGLAAATGKTIIVDDVNAFPDHIACDANSKSEIVVPVFNVKGSLIAVLDVDSTELSAFDHNDRSGLEEMLSLLQLS